MHVRVYSIDTSLILNHLRESSVKIRRYPLIVVSGNGLLFAECVLGLVLLIACNLLTTLDLPFAMDRGPIKLNRRGTGKPPSAVG